MNSYILKFEDVNYSVNRTNILENISFSITNGDFLSIVGPNGSGKTTLLKLILGILKSQTGEIIFNEIDNSRSIGYVPQTKTLDRSFPATAIELVVNGINRRWNFRLNNKQINEAYSVLKSVNAAHLAKKQLSDLSGGELQRIYLARAIIRHPRILLLDEPATGIDLVCEKDISSIISGLISEYNTTVIMVTHDWSSAYHHTNKLLLLNKQMIYFGNPHQGFTDENMVKTFSNTSLNHNVSFGIKNVK